MDASVAIALVFALDSDKPPGKRRKWSKDGFLKRETYGHVNLLQELRVNEPEDFRNFLRMDAPSFDELLGLVEPLIRKEDTVMRPSISPSERLSITLRYLASGNSFEDLKFLTARSPQAIGKLVIDTCEAIILCLKRQQTIKVSKVVNNLKTCTVCETLLLYHTVCETLLYQSNENENQLRTRTIC